MLKTLFNPDLSGKNTILFFIFVIFLSSTLFSSITRGPEVGEIYFIGPTATAFEAIYHSTDYGETAICVDSISEMGSICADLTTGSLYPEFDSPIHINIYIS